MRMTSGQIWETVTAESIIRGLQYQGPTVGRAAAWGSAVSDLLFNNVGTPEVRATEECAEVIHILCKMARFGATNWHPKDPGKTPNWLLAIREIDDAVVVLGEMKKKLLNEYAAGGASMNWTELLQSRGNTLTCDNCQRPITPGSEDTEFSMMLGEIFCTPDCARNRYFDYLESTPVED